MRGLIKTVNVLLKLTAERAKRYGFNHLIGYNYAFTPGLTGYITDFPKVLSKHGILTSVTLPHAKDFKWNLDDSDQKQRYKKYCEFIIRKYQNVPGIVFYAMNHNATGYFGDQNPLKIDGIYSPDALMIKSKNGFWKYRNQARKAEKLARSIDPSRLIYHHQSGNLGDVYTLNCYLNWAPSQERSDWLEHWEKNGKKPLMIVEWGIPHGPTWSSYRGPLFIWRYPAVQCIWLNEYNAAFMGEKAYLCDKSKIKSMKRQVRLCSGNKKVRFSSISSVGGNDVNKIRSFMIKDNFRAMRARGISGLLPWDQGTFWYRTSSSGGTRLNTERFNNIKSPGVVPDYFYPGSQPIDDLKDNFRLGEVGKNAVKNFCPLLGWIAGEKGDFTEKGHNFYPGETVNKQLVILNDSRNSQKVDYKWQVSQLNVSGKGQTLVKAGEQKRIPFSFVIPVSCLKGELIIDSSFKFAESTVQKDSFVIDVISCQATALNKKIALFDPENSTAELLRHMKMPFKKITRVQQLRGFDIVILGRNSLSKLEFNPLKGP